MTPESEGENVDVTTHLRCNDLCFGQKQFCSPLEAQRSSEPKLLDMLDISGTAESCANQTTNMNKDQAPRNAIHLIIMTSLSPELAHTQAQLL